MGVHYGVIIGVQWTIMGPLWGHYGPIMGQGMATTITVCRVV